MTHLTIHISDETWARAEAIRAIDHSKIEKSTIDQIRDDLTSDWRDVDRTYIALQGLWHLHNRAEGLEKEEKRLFTRRWQDIITDHSETDQILDVEFVLDMNLATERNTSIREDEVMTLINFRRAFEDLVRWETRLRYVHIGCIAIGFLVRIPNILKMATYNDMALSGAGIKLMERKLGSSTWEAAARRFGVSCHTVASV